MPKGIFWPVARVEIVPAEYSMMLPDVKIASVQYTLPELSTAIAKGEVLDEAIVWTRPPVYSTTLPLPVKSTQ
jgi:hypothetical protein